jgi:hypothetical protein
MKKVLALVLGMLLISSVAFAKDVAKGTITVTGLSSASYSSLTVDPDGGTSADVSLLTLNVQGAYFILPNIGVGGLVGYQSASIEDTDISEMMIGALGIYNFSLSPQMSLFANGAVGYMSATVDTGTSEDMTGYFFSAGGGVKYFLVENVSVDGFVNYSYSSLKDGAEFTISGLNVGGGFSIYFK